MSQKCRAPGLDLNLLAAGFSLQRPETWWDGEYLIDPPSLVLMWRSSPEDGFKCWSHRSILCCVSAGQSSLHMPVLFLCPGSIWIWSMFVPSMWIRFRRRDTVSQWDRIRDTGGWASQTDGDNLGRCLYLYSFWVNGHQRPYLHCGLC